MKRSSVSPGSSESEKKLKSSEEKTLGSAEQTSEADADVREDKPDVSQDAEVVVETRAASVKTDDGVDTTVDSSAATTTPQVINVDEQPVSADNPDQTATEEVVQVKEEKSESKWEGRWQLIPTTVRQRMNYLLTTSNLSDCKVIIGKPDCQQEFKLHSTILSMSSPEFEDMLKESKEITIGDIEPEVFKQILEYVYLDYVNLWSVEKTQLLYRACVRFKLPHLCEKAVEYMMAKISLDNVWPIYEAALCTQDQILTNECKKFFQKHISDLLRHPKFPTVDQTIVASLVGDENLGVPEADLVRGVLKWAHRKCVDQDLVPNLENKRSVLRESTLRQLRFLALPKEFFVQHVAYSKSRGDEGILTMEESYALLMNMVQPDSYPLPEGFTSTKKPRSLPRETKRLIRRMFNPLGNYQSPASPRIDKLTVLSGPTLAAPYGCKIFTLDLVVSTEISLVGIQVPTFFPGIVMTPGAVKFYEESYVVSLQNPTGAKMTIGSINWSGKVAYSSSMDLMFKESIKLEKNQTYTIMVYTNNTYYLNQKLCTVEESHGVRFTLKDSVALYGKPGKQDFGFIAQLLYSV